MNVSRKSLLALSGLVMILAATSAQLPPAVDLQASIPFRFVTLGDTRFHDPSDTGHANPVIRQALVSAITDERPAFICITGDIVYRGDDTKDWLVWDSETAAWREHKIPIYPALGNHALKGDEKAALANYFHRFPEIAGNRFYALHAANSLILVLDSSLDELSGAQGSWIAAQLDHLSTDVDFVFLVFHHPPYTSSSDQNVTGGHSARSTEQALGRMLEERQPYTRARFIVFSGHVHNYEHQEHNGVIYLVTGGGGAPPYRFTRTPDDLYRDPGVNYHYLLIEVKSSFLKITMHKAEIGSSLPVWTVADIVSVTVPIPGSRAKKAGSPVSR